MGRVNFDDYKFRPHALGKLMVGMKVGLTVKQQETFDAMHPRYIGAEGTKPLTDKQMEQYADLLSKKVWIPKLARTTETYLKKLHKQELFNRNKDLSAKYLDKGLTVEKNSIDFYSRYTGIFMKKNKERKRNDWFSGECDISAGGKIVDIKSSWDFESFPLHDKELPSDDYFYQMQAYLDLWGMDEGEVVYVLMNTPEMIVADEKRRLGWKLGYIELPEELEKETEWAHQFDDIPDDLRIITFQVKKDEEVLKVMKAQCQRCREFLNELSDTTAERIKNYKEVLEGDEKTDVQL